MDLTELEKFYLATRSHLLGYLRGYVRDVHTAEELMQQSYLELISRVNRGETIDNPGGYVYRAGRNAALNYLKRKKMELKYNTYLRIREQAKKYSVPEATDPGDWEKLKVSIAALPSQQQEVLVLKVWHSMKFEQIAEVTASPLSTVLSRYQYAIRKLEKLIDREVDDGI
ncbi:RNA polymerase sigma factor [Planctomycetota bacterium]